MDTKTTAAELLELLKQGIVSGSQAITKQFPILCEQILRWGMIENFLFFVLSISMLSIFWKLIKWTIKKGNTDDDFDNPLFRIIWLLSGVAVIMFSLLIWMSIFDMAKLLSAPNLYLMDYFKSLLTPSK